MGELAAQQQFVLREARDSDVAYIAKAWKQSDYESGAYPWGVDKQWASLPRGTYFAACNPVVDKLIAQNKTIIVADPDNQNYIAGWCCFGVGVLHFVYVRRFLQQCGLADMLINEALGGSIGQDATHRTKHKGTDALFKKYGLQYRPELVY